MTRLEAASASVLLSWTRLYTAGLPAPIRDRRREEITADLHGQLDDARSCHERPARTAAAMVSRLVRGIWHDLSWRHDVSSSVRMARWQARRGWWIAGAFLMTLAAGMVWFSYGLSLRNNSDHQPVRLAAQAAEHLTAGSRPGSVLPPVIDIASNPALFVIVYDPQHRVLASSARLNGRTPALPAGVLTWVAGNGQDRITWQPEAGLREAAVIEPYGGPRPGFVLAARSLRGTSSRQEFLTWSIAWIWLAALAISFLGVRLLPTRNRQRRPKL